MAAHNIVLLIALLCPLDTAAAPAFTLVCTLHDENSSREWTMEVDPGASTVDGRRAKMDGAAIAWDGNENGFVFRHQNKSSHGCHDFQNN